MNIVSRHQEAKSVPADDVAGDEEYEEDPNDDKRIPPEDLPPPELGPAEGHEPSEVSQDELCIRVS